jgi:hypothetical protein
MAQKPHTWFLSPPCWRPDRVKRYPPVQQHWLDAGYESVVDEPQLSYYLVHVRNPTENCFQFTLETPTENCFFQFTLETQQKTASSSSPWKPNRKLFLPVHLGNPTENCFLTIYHPSFMVHWWGPTHREREKMKWLWQELGRWIVANFEYDARKKEIEQHVHQLREGGALLIWRQICVFFLLLSLSLHLFSPLVHVDDLLLSFCFVMWTVTCRRSSLQWSKGEVCVYARGARGLVLVTFWCRLFSCGEKFFQPICRRLDNNGLHCYFAWVLLGCKSLFLLSLSVDTIGIWGFCL